MLPPPAIYPSQAAIDKFVFRATWQGKAVFLCYRGEAPRLGEAEYLTGEPQSLHHPLCLISIPGQGELVPVSCVIQNQYGWWGLSARGQGKMVLLGEAAWWGSAPHLPPLHPPAAGFYSDQVPAFPHGPACT